MSGDISWHGDLIDALLEIRAKTQDLTDDLVVGARDVMTRALELTPDAPTDGHGGPPLKATALINTSWGGENTVAMEFTSEYAHWIHEHIWFKHPHGGQAKFLESAMTEKRDSAMNEIARHLWERLT